MIAFELVAGISLIYDEIRCDRQSTSYETILRPRIGLNEMFSNSICPRSMENWDKSAVVQVSAFFGNREHVQSGRVF